MFQPKNRTELLGLLNSNVQDTDSVEDTSLYRYAVYIRKSSETEDKQERSLRDQRIECKEYMESQGLIFSNSNVFEESKSAKESGIRPVFRKMIDEVESGKYDGIVSWHPNRLARNMKEGGEILDLLDKQIIKDLKFVSFTYTNDTSGKMLLGMTFVLSKQYSDHLSDSVLRGNKRSIEEGRYINKAKHGYIKDRNNFLRPDGNNFSLVVDAFEMRLQGKTLDEIAEHMNKHNYSRRNSVTGKVYDRKMDKEKVRRFLKDPIYTGVIQYGKNKGIDLVEIYGFIPAVSVEDFMKINKLDKKSDLFKLAKSYKQGNKVKSDLLRHCVKCAGCGEVRSTSVTSKKLKSGKKKEYFYYRCDTDGCRYHNKSTRAKVIIDFVQNYFNKKPFSTEKAYKHYSSEFKRVAQIRGKEKTDERRTALVTLASLEERAKDLKSAMVIEKDSQVKSYQKEDLKDTQNKIFKIKDKIESLNEDIDRIKSTPMTYSEFLELFDNMAKNIAKPQSMKDLDTKLRKVFLNFTVNKKSVEGYTLNEPFASLESIETPDVSLCAR